MNEIDLNEFLQLIIKDKGGTPKQYNQLMDYIAYHETGHKQRMDPKAKQISGSEEEGFYDGPGRGLFMFEEGEEKGGNLAVNRTVNYLERNNQFVPQWLRGMWEGKKSVDVSGLNADQQKMLFLGYHREHPSSNFSKVWSGEQSISDFWLRNHWAGTDNPQEKLELFNKNMMAKDSTDALKAREEELMYKQNMAPYLSNSNNINKLPKENDILNSIFGAKDSSLIKEYDNGGVRTETEPTAFNYNKINDYSGKNLKDDWLWNNVTKYGLQAAKWLGETAIPKNPQELLLMTGGGAAIGGIAKHAPKLLSSLVSRINPNPTFRHTPDINVLPLKELSKKEIPLDYNKVISNRVNYLKSDDYRKLRMANTGESADEVNTSIKNYLNELDEATIDIMPPEQMFGGALGSYMPGRIKVGEFPNITKTARNLDHETGHLLSPSSKEGAKAIYKNYPRIEVSKKNPNFYRYMMDPGEQQTRMVRYKEALKSLGWDGSPKGLTNEIIDKSLKRKGFIPEDIMHLLENVEGAKIGSKKWYETIKKTLPHAWGIAPVTVTQLKE